METATTVLEVPEMSDQFGIAVCNSEIFDICVEAIAHTSMLGNC